MSGAYCDIISKNGVACLPLLMDHQCSSTVSPPTHPTALIRSDAYVKGWNKWRFLGDLGDFLLHFMPVGTIAVMFSELSSQHLSRRLNCSRHISKNEET
ncbi:hypothetical protein RIR_jg32134.t1 [Rhizophagus irregularis DAOM 181602=DAOM 197198]|uniref:Uncharacterized protein n=1 Tax=Rhizophagus irregularis (strain DAOM 181602 / DAOM 197198 / MUCL 43194) TaxID=747089 RepID=U9THV4_RHIID|nr:hypothetical protein RIR_jg32134.t1 [Rhizophagus irregularis DAOM 181602=DAOM 197198]